MIKMRKMDSICMRLFCVLYVIYPYSLNSILKKIRYRIYSYWVGKTFKSIGRGTIIQPLNQLEGSQYISIGNNCIIGKGVYLTAIDFYNKQLFTPSIIIGNNCCIGPYSHISSTNMIRLGNGVRMGKMITIIDNSHGEINYKDLKIQPNLRPIISKGPIIINDNVWIGDKATLLSGIIIGEGAIIGANSVVTKNIPPYSLCVGTPARIIKSIY